MYLKAMIQLCATTKFIESFIKNLNVNKSIFKYIDDSKIPSFAKDFLSFTFNIINSEKPHLIAAVFTFGRKDLIPEMFVEMVKNINALEDVNFEDLIYYIERHIEIDSQEHGPMAIKMINKLCGNDEIKWKEAIDVSKLALIHRINLWDSIEKRINK
tara:strand:+ start:232 stop:702 length:471 start_codon:yes stop_codon:yes gene_type:complete